MDGRSCRLDRYRLKRKPGHRRRRSTQPGPAHRISNRSNPPTIPEVGNRLQSVDIRLIRQVMNYPLYTAISHHSESLNHVVCIKKGVTKKSHHISGHRLTIMASIQILGQLSAKHIILAVLINTQLFDNALESIQIPSIIRVSPNICFQNKQLAARTIQLHRIQSQRHVPHSNGTTLTLSHLD